jgi:hypothetical protein
VLHIILKVGHPKIILAQISEQKILMWFLSHNIPKNELRWEVIVHFVDIDGIVDHHCLYFLLFCWHWWNCWSSLFILSFVLLTLVELLIITV